MLVRRYNTPEIPPPDCQGDLASQVEQINGTTRGKKEKEKGGTREMHAKRVAILITERGAQASATKQQAKARRRNSLEIPYYVRRWEWKCNFGSCSGDNDDDKGQVQQALQLLMQLMVKISELSRGVAKKKKKREGRGVVRKEKRR